MITKEEIERYAVKLSTPFLNAGPVVADLDEADLGLVLNRLRQIRPELKPNHVLIPIIQNWKARHPMEKSA